MFSTRAEWFEVGLALILNLEVSMVFNPVSARPASNQ